MEMNLDQKKAKLDELIRGYSRVAVAFSGGVDSSYLLAACADVLGPDRVVAVTVDSPLLPREELRTAREVADGLAVRHVVLPMDELDVPDIANNPPRRCYHCKRLRFLGLLEFTQETDESYVLLHGENADDAYDYRPGSQAAEELAVEAPLADAGLTKSEVRELSRRYGLPTWDHPAAACLATRFPYGTRLTREGLARVEAAEGALHGLLGFRGLRVRDHYPVARIELPPDQLQTVCREPLRSRVAAALRDVGYRYVTLDLEGYRMGSMNDELEECRRTSE